MILTKKEREFIEDWLSVMDGEMDKLEFFEKWGTKKDDRNFLDDYERVRRGEMSVDEFREVDGEGEVEELRNRHEAQVEEEVREQEEDSE